MVTPNFNLSVRGQIYRSAVSKGVEIKTLFMSDKNLE